MFSAGDQVPVIPLFDVVGNGLNAEPEQIAGTGVKEGVALGVTVMVKVFTEAHCPAVGVNVYVVVFVLSKAGDHVPVIPFVEVVGKALSAPPEQMGATAAKVGVIIGLTVTVKGAVTAHKPAVGVKVYVVVVVLFKAGDHIPVIPFVEVVGNGPNAAPEQIAATGLNVGVTGVVIITVAVATKAHKPAVGVNV